MNFIKKVCASLLVVVITVTVGSYILAGTLLNAHYLQSKAASQNLYGSMAQALPASLVPGDTSQALAAQQGLSGLITNAYLKNKVDPFLEQIQAYFNGNGPAPQLDFSDLAAEAQRTGVDLPAGSLLSRPIGYNAPASIKTGVNWLNLIKLAGPILALLLLAALVLISRGWHRFTAVAKVCLVAAAAQGLLYLLFKVAPGMLDSLVKSKANAGPMATLIIGFSKFVLADAGNDFGRAALVLIGLAIVALIAGLVAKAAGFVGRHTGGDKPGDRYTRPNPDNRPSV